jgi:hypothetical protein
MLIFVINKNDMEIDMKIIKRTIIKRFSDYIYDRKNFNKWFERYQGYTDEMKNDAMSEALFGQYLRYCVMKSRASKQPKID